MTPEISKYRYHRSPPQRPYPHKDSESWGSFVRYVELGDDGYAVRHVDEYENGNLSRYDREKWDDQFGTLANFRFGDSWIQHWGVPEPIAPEEFEAKWHAAGASPVMAAKRSAAKGPPPWLT